MHWTLAIICHPNLIHKPVEMHSENEFPCIVYMDSLDHKTNHKNPIIKKIRDYLKMEWEHKKMDAQFDSTDLSHSDVLKLFNEVSFPGYDLPVPKQPNSSDCGVYLLHYVQKFAINPILSKNEEVKKISLFIYI